MRIAKHKGREMLLTEEDVANLAKQFREIAEGEAIRLQQPSDDGETFVMMILRKADCYFCTKYDGNCDACPAGLDDEDCEFWLRAAEGNSKVNIRASEVFMRASDSLEMRKFLLKLANRIEKLPKTDKKRRSKYPKGLSNERFKELSF